MVKTRQALLALLALALCLPAAAADYYFRVNELKAELSARPDGLVDIRYAITFAPLPGSHAVDIVDIGMPNDSYDLGTARASIAGSELSDIRKSEYVKPGVEVHLGGSEIPPGGSGTLEFTIRVANMVYPDSDDGRFASLEFKTTWYDGKYVAGNADLIEVRFNLPPGTRPEEVKYHGFGRSGYEPSESYFQDGRVVYVWRWLDRPASVPYAAGASFPKNLVAAVYSPPKTSVPATLLAVFFAFFGFAFTLSPVWIIVLIIIFAVRSGRRRMKQYLPPRIGIESGGIKRGLTPPEAGLLQELPLPQVLLLIVFGLLKKGALSIKEAAARDFRFQYLKKDGLEHSEYETAFLAAINAENRLDKTALRKMFTDMIAALQKKMAGFSRRETNMYYQSIMNKAWEQVKSSPRDKLPAELAASLEWLALDPEYEGKLTPYADDALFPAGGRGYWYNGLPQRASGSGGAAPGKGYVQTVSGAASRLVQSLQVFSGALLGESASFTSAVTQVTNPPPVASSSGSGGHSGSSCACACACAGCACACAGGGR